MSTSNTKFDLLMGGSIGIEDLETPAKNLLELIFKDSPFRTDNPHTILSHDGLEYLPISLKRMRHIVYHLIGEIEAKGLKPGDTVIVSHLPGTNELFVALLFTALSAMGLRSLLPMFMETQDLLDWIQICEAKAVIFSHKEVTELNGHEKEKDVAKKLTDLLQSSPVQVMDLLEDFPIRQFLYEEFEEISYLHTPRFQALNVEPGDREILIVTTSGTSGQSKLVSFKEKTFLTCCGIWQMAGSFAIDRVGGKAFTPIFSQILGIRTYINAIWTGHPICLVNTEWFIEKPEAIRFFFMQMLPDHMTGGYSAFNLLLEMVRVFPEVKETVFMNFKTLVSTGSPFSEETKEKIISATGLKLHNAYGLTETQSVLQTIVDPSLTGQDGLLGRPLPGVTLGFEKFEGYEDAYKLYIRSPFGMSRILNAKEGEVKMDEEGFLDSGDIVRLIEGNIYYVGRENKDFFKDGYGVKVPIPHLREYYTKVTDQVEHLEYFPLKGDFGLATLIFLGKEKEGPSKLVEEKETLGYYKSMIKEINNGLFNSLEPFEFRHRKIKRFAILDGIAPKTAKGTVSSRKLQVDFPDIIKELTDNLNAARDALIDLEEHEYEFLKFTRYVNPYIGSFLEIIGIDYSYKRAEGNLLYTRRDNKEIEVLDMVGGYGTNLLGHNNPAIRQALLDFVEQERVPLSDQATIQHPVGELAESLNAIMGEITGKLFNVSFGNSGAEVVEMALHHALYEWDEKIRKMKDAQFSLYGGTHSKELIEIWKHNQEVIKEMPVYILALKSAFHGNTSGARALQSNPKKREPFSRLSNIKPVYIDDAGDYQSQIAEALKNTTVKLKRMSSKAGVVSIEDFDQSLFIAAIAEPIRGEGGIRITNKDCLRTFSRVAFPLIMDEIQSGLGRSGKFIASQGIDADYYTFSKSLGGNYVKIAALMIDMERYKLKFGEKYSSTFGNGGLAATVANKVLQVIIRDKIPARARERGEYIKSRFEVLQKKFPDILLGVEGEGLMLGLHFNSFADSDRLVLRMLNQNDILGYFFAAYLLENHAIRILPSISAPNVLRIEPSVYIHNAEIDRAINAIDEMLGRLQQNDSYGLFRFMMEGDPFSDYPEPLTDRFTTRLDPPAEGAEKVVFVSHFVNPVNELRAAVPSFGKASATGLRILFNKIQRVMMMEPGIAFSRNIHHNKIHLTNIFIPLDAATMEDFKKKGKKKDIIEKIQKVVNMANIMGAKCVGLGGYTSILTNNGLSLVEPEGTKVLTGNSMTVAGGVKRVIDSIKEDDRFRVKKNVVGIVGATGNIGSQIAEEFLVMPQNFSKMVLLGSNQVRLDWVREALEQLPGPGLKIETSTDLAQLQECDVISVATNTNDPILFAHHIANDKPVIISDISVPAAVAKEVIDMPNVQYLVFSSFVFLPHDPDLLISTSIPKGSVYCCTAEAILFALSPSEHSFRGKIQGESVRRMKELGMQNGMFSNMGELKKSWKAAKTEKSNE